MTATTARPLQRFGRVLPALVAGILVAMLAVGVFFAPAGAQDSTLPDGISDVRFGDHGTFERAVIDISTAGVNPDAQPTFSYSYRDGDQLLRVNLPTVGTTAKTDGLGLNRAISRYYVVRAPGAADNLFVDFHLKGAASSVEVFKLENPARIVVDVAPGGTALFPKPATSNLAVTTVPRANNLVGSSGTFAVRGYARPFEAQGTWRIKNASRQVVRQGAYRTNDWATTWGSYAFTAGYPATLSGKRGTLEVGQHSPNDGTFSGASTPVRFR